MFYQNMEEENCEGKCQTEYQPDINQLDVRCGGQLVRDGHVESVESVPVLGRIFELFEYSNKNF